MADHNERISTGQSWTDFCRALEKAGDVILREKAPNTLLDRAEGWRYLTRLTRIGLEMFVESADPDFPIFYRASHETGKIGADNPDNLYWNATVTGDREYRITGTRGTIFYFSIGSKANRYAIDGTMASTGELREENMVFGPNGEVEIIASAKPQPKNWLPLAADSTMLLIRQSYLDRKSEKPGEYKIERIGGPKEPKPLDPAALDTALQQTAAFVQGTARTFAEWSEMFMKAPNTFPVQDQSFFNKAGGDPEIHYQFVYWTLKPDEALVIETEVPEAPYWNFQLDNWWYESLDYRYHSVTINKHTAKRNSDGSLTIVVAARDPGFGNWMNTVGHETGTALLRWVKAKTKPVPKCRVAKLSELTRPGAQAR